MKKKKTLPMRRVYHNSNNIIKNHIKENFSLYFICSIIFIIGIIIGVLLVNNRSEAEKEETSQYINNSIIALKENSISSKTEIFNKSLSRNMIILLIIWIFGLTFFGKYILYLILIIYGITFGYTSSSVLSVLSLTQGMLFLLSSLLLQNIITIPSLIFLIVQGIKSHNNLIFTNSISRVFVRYSAYCIAVAILLICSSFIESFLSLNIVYKISKYL